MTHFIKKLFGKAGDLIYCSRCPYCGRLTFGKGEACEKCREQFPETFTTGYAVGGSICVAPFGYEGIFRDAVIAFKFNRCANYDRKLAIPISRAIRDFYSGKSFDCITCVPMHKKALKSRGYNQAKRLALRCAELTQLKYEDLLVKTKMNRTQHMLSARERAENVRGVYAPLDKNKIKGKTVLLVDDIITTGHTLGECSRILKKYGAAEVCCCTLCVARII